MKKWIILTFCLIGCGSAVVATPSPAPAPTMLSENYSWEDQEINGMKYRFYFMTYRTQQTGYALFVVNLTKDELEVQLLKKQLNQGGSNK